MLALYRKNIPVYIFFAIVAFLYLHNLTRDVYSGDVGDLVTASCVWGVAHPSGYPLFTFIGNLLCHLPLSIPPVTKVGLISAIASFAGLIFFYKLSLHATKSVFLSLISTSILAFSNLFWLNAEIPEVFALNNFFVIVILYFAILFHDEKKPKYLYLTAFFSGLAISHHHTIIFVFPAVLILILKHFSYIWKKKLLFKAILLSLAGLMPYLYIPIAAFRNPIINWDNARNLTNFLHLFLRVDYGTAPTTFNTGVPEAAKIEQMKRFLNSMVLFYSYQTIFLMIVGIIQLFRTNKRLLISLLIAFILTGPFFIYYSASLLLTVQSWGIIERFYSLPTVIAMFFVPYGFVLLKHLLDKRFSTKTLSLLILAYFVIVPLMLVKYNFPKTNLSKTHIGNDLGKNILQSLPQNSVIFLSGDTSTFNTWYVHYVLDTRPDVQIIHSSAAGGNYYLDDQINKYHQHNPQVPLSQVFRNTIGEILQTKPIFSTSDPPTLPSGTKLIPVGLLNEILPAEKVPNKNDYFTLVEKNLRLYKPARRETLDLSEEGLITLEIPLLYSKALVRIGDFSISQYNDYAKAEHYYRRALWIDDTNPSAYSGLSIALFKGYKDCANSIYNMKEAINAYPVWSTYYKQLDYIYKQCKVDQKTINQLEQNFKQRFNSSIDKMQ